MDELKAPSKFDLLYAESNIVFTISDCSPDKGYSFWNLDKEHAKRFLKRLQYIEKHTWKQFMALSREAGATLERFGSESFNMIDARNTSFQMVEKYYFHFRVDKVDKFRVFGYQRGQFFSITHIDYQGEIHHS